MAKNKEKKVLDKKSWVQNFTLVGKAVINDYTFKIDQRSKNSDWIYNMMNLKVDCGDKYGVIDCKMMGGYSGDGGSVIYVHGKKEDNGRMVDDFENGYQIDWEDRLDEDVLNDIGELCFLKVGIETDTKDNVVVNKFLHQYDAINYIKENLQNGTEIKVRGRLKYNIYQGNITVEKEISEMYLRNEAKDKIIAEFTQTVLMDKSSLQKPDTNKCVFPINCYILEKFKEYNGNDLTEGGAVKGGKFVPLTKTFEYEYNPENMEKTKKIVDTCFAVKKDVTKATFIGYFREGGAVITATEDDLDESVKELITLGFYTLEEALAKCAGNGGKERHMCFLKPQIKTVGDDDNKSLQVQIFPKEYTDDDLVLDYLFAKDEDEDEKESVEVTESLSDADDDSWLNLIG